MKTLKIVLSNGDFYTIANFNPDDLFNFVENVAKAKFTTLQFDDAKVVVNPDHIVQIILK